MKRGDIFTVAGGKGPAGKPRPCLIVQRGSTLDNALKVTICPISTAVRVGSPIRPLLHPTPENGLERVSQVEIDWIFTYRVERLGKQVGTVDGLSMRRVDAALRRWLDL